MKATRLSKILDKYIVANKIKKEKLEKKRGEGDVSGGDNKRKEKNTKD